MEIWRQNFNERRRLQRALYRLEHPRQIRSHNKIKKNCLYCDKEFWVFPSLQRVECCSRKCAGQLRGAQAKGKLLKPIIRSCACCEQVLPTVKMGLCDRCWKGYNRGRAWLHKWNKTPRQIEMARARARKYARQVAVDPERKRFRNLRQRENEARRRAQEKSTRIGRVSYQRILATYGMICSICGRDIIEGQLSFDHVIPLVRGGTHTEDNLRPAHRLCNVRKNRRLPEEIKECLF